MVVLWLFTGCCVIVRFFMVFQCLFDGCSMVGWWLLNGCLLVVYKHDCYCQFLICGCLMVAAWFMMTNDGLTAGNVYKRMKHGNNNKNNV